MDLHDWNFGFLRRPTTPAGWVVMAWTAIFLLIGFGAVALYVAARLPAGQFADAATLRDGAFKAFAFAAAVFVVKSGVQWVMRD